MTYVLLPLHFSLNWITCPSLTLKIDLGTLRNDVEGMVGTRYSIVAEKSQGDTFPKFQVQKICWSISVLRSIALPAFCLVPLCATSISIKTYRLHYFN